ncbi:hypothetical protein ACFL59_11850 [Planctomycetota bacterium]
MELIDGLFTQRAVRILDVTSTGGPVRLTVVAREGKTAEDLSKILDQATEVSEERAPRVFNVETTTDRIPDITGAREVIEVIDGAGRVYGRCPVAAGARVIARVIVDGELTDEQRKRLTEAGLKPDEIRDGAVSGETSADRLVDLVLADLLVELS